MENTENTWQETHFIDVVLPVPIPQLFTYRLPRDIAPFVKVGARVVVEFGKSRVLTAIVVKVHNSAPGNYQAKYIQELLDTDPVITQDQIWLFQWVAEYYMCTVGEVLNVALPSGLKISSQSKIQYNPDFNHHELLTEVEKSFLDILIKEDSLNYQEVSALIGEQDLAKFLKDLVAKHAVVLFEEINEKYKPKILKKLRLTPEYATDEEALILLESLTKAKKQQEVLLRYFSFIPLDELSERNNEGVDKNKLKEGLSDSAINTLISKEILEQFEITVSRLDEDFDFPVKEVELSEAQQTASNQILEGFGQKDVVLFHGITGSGKN